MKSHCLPQEVISRKHWPLPAGSRACSESKPPLCLQHTHTLFIGLIQRPKPACSHNSPRPLIASSPLSHIFHHFSVLCSATWLNSRDHWARQHTGKTHKPQMQGHWHSVWRPRNWPSREKHARNWGYHKVLKVLEIWLD